VENNLKLVAEVQTQINAGFPMRIWLASLLCLFTSGVFLAAQSPGGPVDPPSIVIKPKRPGEVTDKETVEKDGFIVIRPNGKISSATQVSEPKRPPTNSSVLPALNGPQTAGILNVPPPGPPPADAKSGRLQFDYWFAVGIEGSRAGYINWYAREAEHNDKQFVIGLRSLNLTLNRFGHAASLSGEESDVETPTGKVLLTTMRQTLGKDNSLIVKGEVKGEKLLVKREGANNGEAEIPWPEGVVGLVREPKLFKELGLKVGESFSYPSYVPTVNWVVKMTISLDGEESRVLWPNTPARKLLKFTAKPAPIIAPNGKIKLPSSISWVDAETYELLLQETDFPSLGGRLSFLRTTKEAATAAITRPVEVFTSQSIPLNRGIPGIHQQGTVVYKVTVPRDDEPETVFATDGRQKISNLDEKTRTFELRVTESHGPEKNAAAQPAPGKEFIESNFFINWDNELVKTHAAKAMAGLPRTAGSWDKAVAVEQWVNQNMKAFEFSQTLATSDNVAKTLSGDCKQYAMLAAAMCRAAGVPSRTALGVVHATKDGKAFMAYHMWYEVYADGQWLPLDATLGYGGIGPGHIKITDHNWYEEKSFAPLLPVLRTTCARPTIEVLKVEPRDR
jgi:predicted transglutaminase-like cysteine proteinase